MEGALNKIAGLVAGLAVFGIWMNIVRDPQVAETVIGVVFSLGAGFWAWRGVSRAGTQRTLRRLLDLTAILAGMMLALWLANVVAG